jgi:hypothetical protein
MKLGHASPAKMLAEMRPSELGMWAALFKVDPWDETRADLRAGVVASAVANFSGRAKRATAPGDFMPLLEKPEKSVAKGLREFLKSRPRKKAR